MAEEVSARCSWTQTAGKELSTLIPTRHSQEDVFVKPDLDDVVSEERAVLFSNSDQANTPCKLRFSISPRFKIAAITLVCSAPKVELFLGPAQEYLETIYGEALEEADADIPISPYRYDVEIDRSGIADINLKLLTSTNELCVYGAMLHIAPNPNGITTQLNARNCLELLSKPFDLAGTARICEELLQSSSAATKKTDESAQKLQQFIELMKGRDARHQDGEAPGIDTKYIDAKFEQLERTISKRLDAFEAQQAEKLDKIIAMLELKN